MKFCESSEFNDIKLRNGDKKHLNELNKHKNLRTIRYQMKGRIKSKEMKVNWYIYK